MNYGHGQQSVTVFLYYKQYNPRRKYRQAVIGVLKYIV